MRAFAILALVAVLFFASSEAFLKKKLIIGGAAAGAAGAVGAGAGFLAGSHIPSLLHHRP